MFIWPLTHGLLTYTLPHFILSVILRGKQGRDQCACSKGKLRLGKSKLHVYRHTTNYWNCWHGHLHLLTSTLEYKDYLLTV